MATALGQRLLVRHYEGTATDDQLASALTRRWVTQVEYDRAITGEAPDGYAPSPTFAPESPTTEGTL